MRTPKFSIIEIKRASVVFGCRISIEEFVVKDNSLKLPILGDEEKTNVFHVGLFQDTTDVNEGPRQAGHYQSLEIVPGQAVPCCNIVTVNVSIDHDVTIDVQEGLRNEAKKKVQTEENILKSFKN